MYTSLDERNKYNKKKIEICVRIFSSNIYFYPTVPPHRNRRTSVSRLNEKLI